ncbi:hypothetical protein KFE25_009287 [Diacronema lutheri]|uniref:Uncharacterized protein n=2 Tax=Diacronema lutheri TaxID=2081491 RepID=A0A8J5XXI5_DIALT|nr:hypothetical protein KFE25_009287 [Diacronema lutheri]
MASGDVGRALKDAWDESDEGEAEAAPSAAAREDSGSIAVVASRSADEDALNEDAVVTDDHGATAEARLFWGCYQGSLRCVARALAQGARADARLTFRVLEELETIVCTAAGARGVQAELGDSALHVAARQGQLECALVLLMQPDPPEPASRPNRRGQTALDVSAPAIRALLLATIAARKALALQRQMATLQTQAEAGGPHTPAVRELVRR